MEQIDLTKKLSKKEYKEKMEQLQPQLAQLQRTCKSMGIPVMIVFEGFGAAGKGVQISKLIQSLDPRGFSVYATGSETEEERMRPFLWRFWIKTPPKGRVAIFDRSWYRIVQVDRFDKVTSENKLQFAYSEINAFEEQLTADGTVIIKLFLCIDQKEQRKRFQKLLDDKSSAWRVSKGDLKRNERYEEYKQINDEMLEKTDTECAPWTVIESTDREFATVKIYMAVIKALTVPGDRVIVQTPAYNCFYSSIRNNGCELLANRLRYEGGAYTIDFDDLETKASDPKAKLLLLCNPHNPVGRVWTREELRRLGEICLRHGVRVVADEIHCELTYEGHDYTPFASLSDDFLHGSVTCNSPSKAFNLAGMQIANIVSADADVRTGIDRAINDNEVCDVNPFGVEALMAAYDRGEEWLDRLREYLADNYRMLCGFFAEYLPQYPVLPLEGTYLVWIDCRTTGVSSEQIAARLLAEAKLMISPGTIYGPGGEDFIRLNIACPGSLLEEGLLRLRKVLGR